MLETIVHFGAAPVAVRVADASVPFVETAADDDSRTAEHGKSATITQAELARQAQEREAIERVLERLNEVASQISDQRHQLLQEMQQVSVELAVAIASQAIYTKIQTGDFPIESLARSAIDRIDGAGPIVVHLHPDDLALLHRRLGGQEANFQREVRFEADASLGRGDCRAETADSGVWCKMRSQFEEMRQRLLESIDDAEIERRKTAADDSGLRRFPDRRQTA